MIDKPLYASFQVTNPTDTVQLVGTELCMRMDACVEVDAAKEMASNVFTSGLLLISLIYTMF